MSDEDTQDLIKRYNSSIQKLKRAKQEVVSDETAVYNLTNKLGQWLTPSDCQAGEVFNIWVDGELLCVKLIDHTVKSTLIDYEISWRKN